MLVGHFNKNELCPDSFILKESVRSLPKEGVLEFFDKTNQRLKYYSDCVHIQPEKLRGKVIKHLWERQLLRHKIIKQTLLVCIGKEKITLRDVALWSNYLYF